MEIEHPKPIHQMQILVCTWSLTQTSNSIQHIAAYHSYSESIFQRVNNRRLIHVSLFSRLFLFGRGLFKQNQNKLITLCYSQIPFWIRSIEHCQSQNSSLRWINVRCIWLVIRFGEAFFWPHLSIWTDCVVCCSVFFLWNLWTINYLPSKISTPACINDGIHARINPSEPCHHCRYNFFVFNALYAKSG